MEVDTIILVGGLGTRLRGVVSDLPKPLAPVNGIPFLDYLLASLPPSRIILAAGYMGGRVAERYSEFLVSVEKEPLGTGGGVRQALEYVQTESVRILNGDSFLDIDHPAFAAAHAEHAAEVTMALHEVDDVSRYGKVDFDLQTHRISSFHEKEAFHGGGWINGGIYLMQRDLIREFPLGKKFSLENDLFPSLCKKPIFGYPCRGTFIDIGTRESYSQAQEILKTYEPHTRDWRSRLHRLGAHAKAVE